MEMGETSLYSPRLEVIVNIEEVQPAHCFARAQRVLGEIQNLKTEMGRPEDTRSIPEITNAQPRECYFAALTLWNKTERLAGEIGVAISRVLPRCPSPKDARPGHVLQLIDGVLSQLDEIRHALHVEERAKEPAIDSSKTPTDVFATLVRANRAISRLLERPFTPSDVYRSVALASAYANQLGGRIVAAPFERGRRPADCYAQLERCLNLVTGLIAKQNQPHMTMRGTPADVVPGDCYDLAQLIVGELAYLHSLGSSAAVQPFDSAGSTHRLPSHVHQLAHILEAQLVVL